MEVEEKKSPVEQPEVSVDYSSYQKALTEKKNVQAKLTSYEQELNELREEKMKREGKTEELLNSYQKKIAELEGELGTTKKSYAWNTLTGAIKREALKNGCTDPEKLIRLMDDSDLRSIEVGEDFSISSESLSGVIEKNKKENFFLFETPKKLAANGMPSTKIEDNKRDLSKLSIEELKELHIKSYK